MAKVETVYMCPADILMDTNDMTACEFGCYWKIIIHMYLSGGKIPFDLEHLKSICNCGENFEKVWGKIEKKFQKSKGCQMSLQYSPHSVILQPPLMHH